MRFRVLYAKFTVDSFDDQIEAGIKPFFLFSFFKLYPRIFEHTTYWLGNIIIELLF